MAGDGAPAVWTVGHSNRSSADYLRLLGNRGIEAVADVRRFPGSRKHPHFAAAALAAALAAEGIEYVHFPDLGGRRRPRPGSRNLHWRNEGFRGYADHMETEEFRAAVERLLDLVRRKRTAIQCAEALWWRCHRSLLADHLKARGLRVLHILGEGPAREHPDRSG